MNSTSRWTADLVGDQSGRTAVITGANTGIGYEAAKVLAARGATVVLACRDDDRAAAAAARIVDTTPNATVHPTRLDLGDLTSVRAAAAALRSQYPRIDLLINNAGVMMPPLGRTADGFELQLGVNHLGHFALTGLLVDRLLTTPGSRVVTVSSSAHRQGAIDLDDPHFERRRYRPQASYGQAKLANVLFTLELQRRLAEAGAATIAVALEPGIVPTDLPRSLSGGMRFGVLAVTRLIGQRDAAAGALATLRAATDPDARGGDYYGPDGRLMRASGHPVRIAPSAAALDPAMQRRLWTVSEQLTGVTFPLATTAAPR
jgi:NAD(P)-dependent dehydrogenase (short-subunit alcohol dehydrogenase family)